MLLADIAERNARARVGGENGGLTRPAGGGEGG